MLSKVKEVESGGVPDEHIMLQLSFILKSMAILAGGGALCGLIAGFLTTVRLRRPSPPRPPPVPTPGLIRVSGMRDLQPPHGTALHLMTADVSPRDAVAARASYATVAYTS